MRSGYVLLFSYNTAYVQLLCILPGSGYFRIICSFKAVPSFLPRMRLTGPVMHSVLNAQGST